MDASVLVDLLHEELGIDTYFGVPDSLLRALCDELIERFGTGEQHLVAENEGGAVALAAGHYLASGKPACVYMQNSGIGNAVNPICSLLNDRVYAIPALFIVGWRGEPGVHDEPQHVFQGACSEELLRVLELDPVIVTQDMGEHELRSILATVQERFGRGQSSALLVKKGALTRSAKHAYPSADRELTREQAVEQITAALGTDAAYVSTTGKLSRELFEIRERRGEAHGSDFLTVGSMGHASMIALGAALVAKDRRVIVLDGDGAGIMHMGALAIAGSVRPTNLVHFLINNQAHDSVGGMPTASPAIDWPEVAMANGYASASFAMNAAELGQLLAGLLAGSLKLPAFIEVRVNRESRADLGRPTSTAYDNGTEFMKHLGAQRLK